MTTTTIAVVLPALKAIIEASPFLYVESPDSFDFEHQPTTRRDLVYRVEAQLASRDGYLGPYAIERWTVTVSLARRRKGSGPDTYAQLLADVSALGVALYRAGDVAGTYHVETEDTDGDIAPPDTEQEYLVARLRVAVEFDRSLA